MAQQAVLNFMENRASFKEVAIKKTTIVEKNGLEIVAFIAGVNSGAYGLPFCIRIKAWARKFWFREFFVVQADLNLEELKDLRDEFDKAILFIEAESRANNLHHR